MTLSRRLLLSASLILFIFLGLTGVVLDRAYTHSATEAVRERLRAQIFMLLATTDFNDNEQRLLVNEPLPDPQLSTPQSGRYAAIYTGAGKLLWKSASAIGLSLPRYAEQDVGHWFFELPSDNQDRPYFSLNFTAAWETGRGQQQRYVFQVFEDHAQYRRQVAGFRNELWGWLLGVSVMLLLAQVLILRWSLKPLRDVAVDLEQVKAGAVERLREDYPGEIRSLTGSINTFIDSERAQRDRYRNTLADLAHSLKTPLAVLRAGIDDTVEGSRQQQLDQLERMTQIVDYQLQRASASGRTGLGKTVPLRTNIERLVDSLDKVHADRRIECAIVMDATLQFPGEAGDLLEMAGNLLENAYKWARAHVLVSARQVPLAGTGKALLITVEDDGSGIAASRRSEVLQRGRRADESVSGHGIGLSVVQEIVNIYQGSLEITDSETLGGACLIIRIPLQV